MAFEKRLLSKAKLNHQSGKAYKLEEGTPVLHGINKVYPKSSLKIQPLQTCPYKIRRRMTNVKYEKVAQRAIILFAQQNHLTLYYPSLFFKKNLFSKIKQFFFQSHVTISSGNPADEKCLPKWSPYDSLEDSEKENRTIFTLTDRHHNSLNATDVHTSSPILLDNSQQPLLRQMLIKNNQDDTLAPTVPPLGATTSQTSVISQFRKTRCLRRQHVKDYRTQ